MSLVRRAEIEIPRYHKLLTWYAWLQWYVRSVTQPSGTIAKSWSSDRDNLSKALNRLPLLLPPVYPARQSGPANKQLVQVHHLCTFRRGRLAEVRAGLGHVRTTGDREGDWEIEICICIRNRLSRLADTYVEPRKNSRERTQVIWRHSHCQYGAP